MSFRIVSVKYSHPNKKAESNLQIHNIGLLEKSSTLIHKKILNGSKVSDISLSCVFLASHIMKFYWNTTNKARIKSIGTGY